MSEFMSFMGGVLVAVIAAIVCGVMLMWMWNWCVPELFNLPAMTIKSGIGLCEVVTILGRLLFDQLKN